MFLAILTLITALSISAVAIYYSVAGLVAIFAAAAIPIIIMGGVLEIGKLVTAVWLHKYWHRATWWLKTYLATAVVVLMFITSMGIFGFLSKAHIEQTSAAGEGVAQIEQIEKEIARQQAVVARAEQIIETTQTSGTGADQNIQSQIDREQERIDTAYDRVQPAIDSTNEKLESDKEFYLSQLPAIDEKLAQFNELSNIDTNDEEAVKRLQSLVGSRPDGAYGGGTARAVKAFKEGLEAERADIFTKIEELKSSAQEEIQRLRSRAESEIDDSNKLITRLRSQLGTSTGEDIDVIIDEQNARIKAANTELDTLTEEKFQLEAEYRKLEAEVGPIKYIAEFIYGEQADKTLLEEAVRWVIIVIIVVFDPLAVLLLIASQYTFGWSREGNDETTEETKDESDDDRSGPEDTDPDGPTDGPDRKGETRVPVEQDSNPEQDDYIASQTVDPDYLENWNEATRKETQGLVEDFFGEEDLVSKEEKERVAKPYIEEVVEVIEPETVEKKDIELSVEEQQRQNDLDELDKHESWRTAKEAWKAKHPELTLKEFKTKYVRGQIDQLPWEEEFLQELEKESYVTKDDEGHQVTKTRYVQNEEQGQNTIWNRLKDSE